ncbi:hypothetical protein DMA12_23475 [Amycolatopsis balhimycina DSM 5908]|uniref:Uncharacterized protein n=1 Tax=Amycolatopsis balhimycina DSM 5908 TaxID=1081091 RepID=A0A428WFP0_AMYBA|nr:hypothetical protein [Amycolatopsis balhimycina]RSM41904.1 hypothetical protein DMA12_23475 [Amycolatopsis balhimycina DSM 5908]
MEVATLHLQHLLLLAAREAWQRRSPDKRFTGSALAELLGTPDSLRPAEKRLAGTQRLQLDDIVRLGLLLGDDVLGAVPAAASDLLPEPYQRLLDGWQPGTGTLPHFRQPGLGGLDWVSVGIALTAYLDAESAAGRDHLLATDAVAYALVQCLTECGTDASRIELSEDLTNDATVRALQLASPTVTISVALAYLPDRIDQPTALWQRTANILRAVAELEADERILVLVAGPAATRQLRTHLSNAATAAPGTEFTLRIQAAMRNQPNAGQHPVGPDLDILLLDRRELGGHGIVLVSSLTKRR